MNVFDLVAKLTLDTSEYDAAMKKASSGMGAVGSDITAAGKSMLPATAAITALGTGAVMTAANFEASMSKVAAISGASGDDFTALSNKAQEMGAKTKFSASQAADALSYMAMAGWKTDDMLSGLDGIMNLAAASGEDLASTSDIVTDALTAFGLKAEDSGHFADVLAAASSNANTNVSMMGETFKYAAPVAGALGFSVEDTAEAIGLMANAGIKGTQAGTSLRTIMNNLSDDVQITGEALGDVTIQTTNADGSMRDLSDILADMRGAFSQLSDSEKAQAAESIAGKNAMSGFLAIMNAAPEDIDKLSGAIENADGSAEDMADTMNNNLSGQMTIMKSQLEATAIAFGNTLAPAVTSVLSVIQKFLDWLNSLDEGTRKVIVTILAVVAAIGPALIVIGKVATGVNALMTIVPAIAGVLSGTLIPAIGGVVAAAAPVIAVILAIVAAVVAVIAIVKNWGAITDWLAEQFEYLSGFFAEIWETIKEVFNAALQFIKDLIIGYFEAVWTFWSTIFTTIFDFVVSIFEAIKNAISTAITAIKDVITKILTGIRDFFTNIWNGIKDFVVNIITGIKDGVVERFTAIKDKISEIWNNIKSAISEKVTAVKTTITEGIQKAVDFLKNLPKNALKWGKDLLDSFIKGIKEKIGAVKDAVKGVADTVKDFIGFSEPDKGPLSNFHTFAPDMIDLFTQGIRDNINKVASASDDLAAAINPDGPTYNGTVAVAAAGAGAGDASGDIIIPVYIGESRIDEIIVTSEQVRNYRSGGR